MDSVLTAAESSIVASFLRTLSNFGQGLDRLLQSCVVGESMSTCARIRKHILLPAVTPTFWVQIACRITTEVVGPGTRHKVAVVVPQVLGTVGRACLGRAGPAAWVGRPARTGVLSDSFLSR